MNVVMPLIVIAVTRALDLPLEIRAALVAISISPVPPILQKNQLGAGGRIEFVTGLLVAMSALAIVLVPLWVWIIDRVFARHGDLGPLAVAKVMLTTVFLPLALGLLVRRFVPAAQRASSVVMGIAGVLLAIVSAILIWGMWPQIRIFIGNGPILVIVAIVVVGLIVGHVLGGPNEGDRTALAMATASRHPAVALAVATSGTLTERSRSSRSSCSICWSRPWSRFRTRSGDTAGSRRRRNRHDRRAMPAAWRDRRADVARHPLLITRVDESLNGLPHSPCPERHQTRSGDSHGRSDSPAGLLGQPRHRDGRHPRSCCSAACKPWWQ